MNLPENAYVLDELLNSKEKPFLYQDAIVQSCQKGYKLVGNESIRVCNQSGMWSGQEIRCESNEYQTKFFGATYFKLISIHLKELKCKYLTAPKNGEIQLNGSIAEYKCEKGFELFYGVSTRYCNATTSEWSGLDPICERKFRLY